MEYIWKYKTPEGFDDLVMSGDGEALTGLWFAGSRNGILNAKCRRLLILTPRQKADEADWQLPRILGAPAIAQIINCVGSLNN